MKKRKLLAIIFVLALCLFSTVTKGSTVEAALEERVFDITLAPGETSQRFNAAMTDQFNVYSNTNSSVAEPIFEYDPTGTYPFFITIKAKSPGKATIRVDGNQYRYRYEVTVTE